MAPFPLNVTQLLGQYGAYLVFLAIGFAFGYALEIAGFGYSPKLAAQFYFKEMTVLKVMFTAIVVAMVGIFLASGLGLLDYNLVWVNPTYLWPGIVGGIIMGFGFIIGGFCPGTSLVAAATAKLDGVFFVLGVLFGIFVFGETVDNFETFFNSSYMGRFTLMDWLHADTGWVVLGVVLMAVFMFWGAEKLEGIFGGVDQSQAPKLRIAGAGLLVVLAVGAVLIGQPTTADKWAALSSEKQPLLEERAYQIHPGELLDLMHNDQIILHMLDVRSESDFNLFHLKGAEHAPMDMLAGMVPNLLLEPANSVFVLMSNDEALATEAWKMLEAENVINVYILEGGINYWLDVFAEEGGQVQLVLGGDDTLRHEFTTALGDRYPIASPEPHEFGLEYVPKVKLELKQGPTGGGCG